MVTIETENILNKYPSIEVYKTFKRDITKNSTKHYQKLKILKKSLNQIGNDELWFDWIDKFSNEMNGNRKLSEPMKKELLKLIIYKIMVEYGPIEKTHILTINFKIPVFIEEGNEVSLKQPCVVITPTKSGRKPKNQIEPVENYSTVTDLAKFLG